MADETFNIGLAVGVQSAFGTPNATVAGLSGSLDSTDGIVLGDKDSGDAESGIAIPEIAQVVREVAQVAGSFTQQADAFLRAAVNGFAVSFPMQGNGVTSTPTTGQALPLAGIDALLQSAGLVSANGTDPVVAYTPRSTAIYLTAKLWIADLSLVFTDALVETLEVVFEPGGSALATANLRVGKHDPATDFADGVTFPTFDYTTQGTLANPVVAGVNHTWGEVRGFEELTVSIGNELETFGDSNVPSTGQRESQSSRVITVDGTLYLTTADSDFEYQQLTSTTAPTTDLSFQVGTVATPTDTLNAFLVECNNLQPKAVKYDRRGTATVATLTGAKCAATAAGGEFTLTYN
jgi:hypothetical protein